MGRTFSKLKNVLPLHYQKLVENRVAAIATMETGLLTYI